jgi:hypothetical protein
MKILFCFIMFFQLVASLRMDAKSSLRSLRATVLDTPTAAAGGGGGEGAKPQHELDEQRSLGKKKVVTTTVAVNVVGPPQTVCQEGATMDSYGKCCGAGETITNGVCCPVGVEVSTSDGVH